MSEISEQKIFRTVLGDIIRSFKKKRGKKSCSNFRKMSQQ